MSPGSKPTSVFPVLVDSAVTDSRPRIPIFLLLFLYLQWIAKPTCDADAPDYELPIRSLGEVYRSVPNDF